MDIKGSFLAVEDTGHISSLWAFSEALQGQEQLRAALQSWAGGGWPWPSLGTGDGLPRATMGTQKGRVELG